MVEAKQTAEAGVSAVTEGGTEATLALATTSSVDSTFAEEAGVVETITSIGDHENWKS
jgi:hypothetical protein